MTFSDPPSPFAPSSTECDTPIGPCRITWVPREDHPDHSVALNRTTIGHSTTLHGAKELARLHLEALHTQLSSFLAKPHSKCRPS